MLKYFLILVPIVFVVSSCKKEEIQDENDQTDEDFEIRLFHDYESGLMASAESNEHNSHFLYYADYSSSNEFEKLSHVIYQDFEADTNYFMILDDLGRLNYFYGKSMNGEYDSIFHSFSYLDNDTILYSNHYYDWQTGQNHVKHQFKVYPNGDDYDSELIFSKCGNDLPNGISMLNTTTSNVISVSASVGAGYGALALGLGPVTAVASLAVAATILLSNNVCASEVEPFEPFDFSPYEIPEVDEPDPDLFFYPEYFSDCNSQDTFINVLHESSDSLVLSDQTSVETHIETSYILAVDNASECNLTFKIQAIDAPTLNEPNPWPSGAFSQSNGCPASIIENYNFDEHYQKFTPDSETMNVKILFEHAGLYRVQYINTETGVIEKNRFFNVYP